MNAKFRLIQFVVYPILFFVIIFSVVVGLSFVSKSYSEWTEGLFRAFDIQYTRYDRNDDSYVLIQINPKKDFRQTIAEMARQNPKIIIVSFALNDNTLEQSLIHEYKNVIYPLDDDTESRYLVIRQWYWGLDLESEFNQNLLRELGIKEKWYNDFYTGIRFARNRISYSQENNLTDKIVVLERWLDDNNQLMTPVGPMTEGEYIVEAVSSLNQFGIEIGSVNINIILLLVIYFINMTVKHLAPQLSIAGLRLYVFMSCQFLVLIVTQIMLLRIFYIWLFPEIFLLTVPMLLLFWRKL